MREYALPREFNDLFYLGKDNSNNPIVSEEKPTESITFSQTVSDIGTVQLLDMEYISDASFELSNKNSYQFVLFISANTSITTQFRLDILSGNDIISSELSNEIVMVANNVYKVQFNSNFNELEGVLDYNGEGLSIVLSNVSTSSSSVTYTIYQNSTYISTFNLNTNKYTINMQTGYLGEINRVIRVGQEIDTGIITFDLQIDEIENNTLTYFTLAFAGTDTTKTIKLMNGNEEIHLKTPYNTTAFNDRPTFDDLKQTNLVVSGGETTVSFVALASIVQGYGTSFIVLMDDLSSLSFDEYIPKSDATVSQGGKMIASDVTASNFGSQSYSTSQDTLRLKVDKFWYLDNGTRQLGSGYPDLLNVNTDNIELSATASSDNTPKLNLKTDNAPTENSNKVLTSGTIYTALSEKQDTLTTAQQTAVDSGINSTLVSQITTNQNDISTINGKIPAQASTSNQLADKDFVNSSIATNTANFIGTFEDIPSLNAYSGTVTNNDYAFVVNSVITDNGSDWASFADLDNYDKDLCTNFDYAWVINGTNFDLYRFDVINQTWGLRVQNTPKASVTLNVAYNRYKAVVSGATLTWEFEYTLNNSSFTASQWQAINSGITADTVSQIIPKSDWDNTTINNRFVTDIRGANFEIGNNGVIKFSSSSSDYNNGTKVSSTIDLTLFNVNTDNLEVSRVSSSNGKQLLNIKTDNAPTENSTKMLSSGTLYTALGNKQDTLTAGDNISIVNNVISAIPGIQEINTQTFYIKDLSAGIYKLTYAGDKEVYYDTNKKIDISYYDSSSIPILIVGLGRASSAFNYSSASWILLSSGILYMGTSTPIPGGGDCNTYMLNGVYKFITQFDVKNNLTSTDTNKPLSANMGKELKDEIDTLPDTAITTAEIDALFS
jgi:hypothetical protein